MIKEYFTDGLIGIAILLSLLRMDLVGINNLINYPEVQEIILGQTAAYLPANFHHIHSSLPAFGNPKHLDLEYDAFNAWFQNVNNLALFRERRDYDIEAFLVSASHENINGQYQLDQMSVAVSENNNNIPLSSLPSLPEESAASFVEEVTLVPVNESNATAILENTAAEPPVDSNQETVSVVADVAVPECDLTKEDLKLIDILYEQDVDLGVGKEIFDPLFREELERERELEFVKHQEREKALLLSKEKEEREKREQKDRWLKKNFRRDGETGEWVQLWNGSGEGSSNARPVRSLDSDGNDDDFITLEAALDFLGNLGRCEESAGSTGCTNETNQQFPQEPLLMRQDSFNENWNGLVDYLNMTANSTTEGLCVGNNSLPQFGDNMNTADTIMAPSIGQVQDPSLQTDYLIQNATLPSSFMDVSTDFNALTLPEETNSSMPFQPASMNSTIDFDLGDLNFFSNLTTLQNMSVDDLDLAEGDVLFQNIQGLGSDALVNKSLAQSMDAIQSLEETLSQYAGSAGSASPISGFNNTFDCLEGATGGLDYTSNYGDRNDSFSKVSRLSESSSDSGFAYHSGFSSPASTASPSYTGSPVSSHGGVNSSVSSNDTERDPHGTRSVLQQQVAHNHTYNTPPGQLPREVKKYAPKLPSRKGPQGRDHRRAEELKIPFSIDDIIESSVEVFNEMLTGHKLSDAQLTLIRDIRRRGKNKVAAQNCRKRKVSVIFSLADEMTDLQKMRDRLLAERAAMDREKRQMKEKFGHLYTHIFQSLRDERGEPYDPNFYSLQQSSDGNVFLVPRNVTVGNKDNSSSSSPSSSSSSKDSLSAKKHRPFDY